jgi:hypothetical protein
MWLRYWHLTHRTTFPDTSCQRVPKLPQRIFCLVAYYNYQIWHYEDIARRDNDSLVVKAKRSIDPNNQLRNDTIERVDEYYIQYQKGDGPYNSETIGSILDRAVINQLKIFHAEELKDTDRLVVLERQREFLINCGEILLQEMLEGTRQIINFRQLKMYNSPDTNPLHGK